MGGSNACDTFNVTTHTIEGTISPTPCGTLKKLRPGPGGHGRDRAHATSPANDVTEFNGMKLAFGDAMPPFTGIKPYVGHTVGASGAIGLIIIMESLARGFPAPRASRRSTKRSTPGP